MLRLNKAKFLVIREVGDHAKYTKAHGQKQSFNKAILHEQECSYIQQHCGINFLFLEQDNGLYSSSIALAFMRLY